MTVNPLTDTELADLRDAHQSTAGDFPRCTWCHPPTPWPCDAARLLATLDQPPTHRPDPLTLDAVHEIAQAAHERITTLENRHAQIIDQLLYEARLAPRYDDDGEPLHNLPPLPDLAVIERWWRDR